ncbi:branched-chain amino acid ABC transporter ATP-binding protein/permease [Streptosporangium sp. CA-115845]|uniref:branched-chain amino acid ABC transporter ATP-binding protein/permease n=1 Tax=Streptosporangium sp. CA-115845 TaxID=3240071 RepID=UPI003D94A650
MTTVKWWKTLRAMPSWGYAAMLGLFLLVLPALQPGYSVTRQVELTLILALVVSGLNLSLGYAGQLAIGQVAMYAAGAYTAGIISVAGVTDLLVQLLAAGTAALVVGIITGIPGLRLGSWSLAMTSFFLVLLVPDIVSIFEEHTGGQQGLTGIQGATLFGYQLTPTDFYLSVVVVTILWFAAFRNIIVSRHGIAFQMLKQSPVLASSVGMSVFRVKLTGYATGAVPAGLAGALFANLDLFVSLDAFGFGVATGALAASILGGSVSVYGALLGAAVVEYASSRSDSFQEYSLVFFGLFLLVGGVLLSGGVAGAARTLVARLDRAAGLIGTGRRPSVTGESEAIHRIDGGLLEATGVSKAFGGNRVLTDVSLRAEPGRVTALIGPNGSGKTTMLNLICGYYRRDAGAITMDGKPIRTAATHLIARLGVARTFQTPLIPPSITVRDVVASGRYTVERTSFAGAILRTPRFRAIQRRDRQRADEMLGLVGLDHVADTEAATLPLGMRRMLEVARALAAEPKVLLLDEAASGLDEAEVETLAEVIRRIRDAGCTIILVEHNFGLVLSLADEIVVLARGSVLAAGTPSKIENDPRVRDEYLGTSDEGARPDDSVIAAAGQESTS